MLVGQTEPVGQMDVNRNLTYLRHFLFDFTYPIWNESKRDEFERMFCRHFYKREIAFETVGLFKHYVQDVFLSEMPKFNRMFSLIESEFSIMDDVNYTTTVTEQIQDDFDGTLTRNENTQNSGANTTSQNSTSRGTDNQTVTTTGSSNETNVQKNAFSDTPEGTLTNVDNNSYLSDYRNINDENEQSTNSDTQRNTTTSDNVTATITETQGTKKDVSENQNTKNKNERLRNLSELVHGKKNPIAISEYYQKYMIEMESAYNLFFSVCDKKLFLFTWKL